jgi:hypothetical protein
MARHHFAMESALQACARREATIAVTDIAVQLDTRFTANASTTLAAQLSGVGQRRSAIQNHALLDGTRQGEVIGETVAIVSLGRRDSVSVMAVVAPPVLRSRLMCIAMAFS